MRQINFKKNDSDILNDIIAFKDVGEIISKEAGSDLRRGLALRHERLADITAYHMGPLDKLRVMGARGGSDDLARMPSSKPMFFGQATSAGAASPKLNCRAPWRIYLASYWRISKGALPRIIHCSAGKDRPGMAVALLLSALDAIDRDWGGMAPYLDGIGVTAPVVARLRADLLEKMEGQRL